MKPSTKVLKPDTFVSEIVGLLIQNLEPSLATYLLASLFTKILTFTFFKSSCIFILVTFPNCKPLYSSVVAPSFKPSALLNTTVIFTPFFIYDSYEIQANTPSIKRGRIQIKETAFFSSSFALYTTSSISVSTTCTFSTCLLVLSIIPNNPCIKSLCSYHC